MNRTIAQVRCRGWAVSHSSYCQFSRMKILMRTRDKKVAAWAERTSCPFQRTHEMRSSIARGALALLSVVALTGCQSGSSWSPTWWNPFRTTSSTTSPNSSVAAAPARPSSLASSSPSGYGTSPTASPYSPYGSNAPSGVATSPNPYGGSYGTAPAGPYTSPVATSGPSGTYPSNYNSAAPSSYSATPGGTSANPYANYGNAQPSSVLPAGVQYPTVAANPYGQSSYPQTGTPYGASTPVAAPAGGTPPCTGDNCPVPGASSNSYATPQGGYGTPARTSAAPSAPYGGMVPNYNTGATPSYGAGATPNTTPNYGAPAAASGTGSSQLPGATSSYSNPVRSASTARSDDRYRDGDRYGSAPAGTPSSGMPANSVADTRGVAGTSAASGLPPSSNPYTPAAGSVYSQPANSTSTPKATSPYPSSGVAPAGSDSGEPAYRPGSTRTSGDFSPRSTSGLSPSSLGSSSSGSEVVPAGYVQRFDSHN